MIVTARAMVRKELRQISRDRRTLLILVFVPALFLLLYGYALNFDIRNIAPGGGRPGRLHGQPRADLGLHQLRLLRLRRRRARRRASSSG